MKSTTNLLNILKNSDSEMLKETIDEIDEMTFSMYFDYLCRIKDVNRGDLIRLTNLSRTYAYQIFNGTKKANRDKIIQIALALQLDLKETERLLKLAGHNALYSKIKRDAIIIYAIERKLSPLATNQLLEEYEFDYLE